MNPILRYKNFRTTPLRVVLFLLFMWFLSGLLLETHNLPTLPLKVLMMPISIVSYTVVGSIAVEKILVKRIKEK